MKNKKILAILTISAIVSVAATGCSFGGRAGRTGSGN